MERCRPTQLKRVVCTVGDKISEGELTELLSNIDIDKSSNSVRPSQPLCGWRASSPARAILGSLGCDV